MIYLVKMFRLCSESVQTLFRIFRLFRHDLFRLCSDNVQNFQSLFSPCSESVQNFQSMFRICSEFSVNVQTFSEFLAQKLVYSEFLDFVVIV